MYSEGSYFGDCDVLVNKGRDGRDGTAVAECECHLLVIQKKELASVLKRFRAVSEEMKTVA